MVNVCFLEHDDVLPLAVAQNLVWCLPRQHFRLHLREPKDSALFQLVGFLTETPHAVLTKFCWFFLSIL